MPLPASRLPSLAACLLVAVALRVPAQVPCPPATQPAPRDPGCDSAPSRSESLTCFALALQARMVELATQCADLVYPEEARRLGLQGTVSLLLDFDAQGRLASTKVEQTTGSALLDERATWLASHAALQPPAQMSGRPFSVSLPLAFRLQPCADGTQPPCTTSAQQPAGAQPAGAAQR